MQHVGRFRKAIIFYKKYLTVSQQKHEHSVQYLPYFLVIDYYLQYFYNAKYADVEIPLVFENQLPLNY